MTIESCSMVQSTLRAWRPDGPWKADLDRSVDAGLCGIGLSEAMLDPRDDMQHNLDLIGSGLRATAMDTRLRSILPSVGDDPSDVEQRIELLCQSVRRLAPFDPIGIAIAGQADDADDDLSGSEVVVDGIQKIARSGAWLHPHGVTVGLKSGSMGAGAAAVSHIVRRLNSPNLKVVLEASRITSAAELEQWAENVNLIVTVRVKVEVDPDLKARAVFATPELDLDTIVRKLYGAWFRGFYEVELSRPPRGRSAPLSDQRLVDLLINARDVVRACVRPLLNQVAVA